MPEPLFAGSSASDAHRALVNRVKRAVDQYDVEAFKRDPLAAAEDVMSRFGLTAPTVDLHAMELEQPRESSPLFVLIPFSGDFDLLNLSPRGEVSGQRPRCELVDGDLRCYLGSPSGPTAVSRERLDDFRTTFEAWLKLHADEIDEINRDLREVANETARTRSESLATADSLISDLGLPIRRRGDAPPVRPSPQVLKRRPKPAASSEEEGRPDTYSLPDVEYEHILQLIRLAGTGMERAPKTFENWGEEERRQAVLLLLNSHYEGRAVAEALNREGHTDIRSLMRV